ncbi:MAG TPA: hypothetical protein VLN44_05735 [Pyrinomonadaceae bacterium]|nr:hypothetical protein [Pyrinomonadaceae bacterium]
MPLKGEAIETPTATCLSGVITFLSGVLVHLNDFTTFVVAALGTDAMLHAWLLTVWTHCSLRHAQRIMRSAFAAT